MIIKQYEPYKLTQADRDAALCPELDQFILDVAPPHIAVATAPESLQELREWQADFQLGIDPLPVWNGASETTIFGCSEVNFAYRAWHDRQHLRLNRTFSMEDELIVGLSHVRQAKDHGLSRYAQDLLLADSVGQNIYFQTHGDFVTDQRAFALKCLRYGICNAIKEVI